MGSLFESVRKLSIFELKDLKSESLTSSIQAHPYPGCGVSVVVDEEYSSVGCD